MEEYIYNTKNAFRPKKPKYERQKFKELRAKKSSERFDIPVFVEVWSDVEVEEPFYDCSLLYPDFEDDMPCKCDSCTKKKPKTNVVGQSPEWIYNY